MSEKDGRYVTFFKRQSSHFLCINYTISFCINYTIPLSGKESGPIIFTSVFIAYWFAKMLIIQITDAHVKAE